MKVLKLLFPSFLTSIWGGISISVFLLLINYPAKLDYSYLIVAGIYSLIFFVPLSIVSSFAKAIIGGEVSPLNSRYLCGLVFLTSTYIATIVYLNISYLKNLLPQKIYFIIIALGVTFGVLSLLSLSLISLKSRVLFGIFYTFVMVSVLFFVYFPHFSKEKNLVPSVSFPLQPSDRKTIVLYMEGLSLDDIFRLTEKGELPNFSYLLEKGAWGKNVSPTPCISDVTFYSFLRGILPANSGYTSPYRYSIFSRGNFSLLPRWAFFQALKKLKIIKIKSRVRWPNKGIVDLVRKTGGRAFIVSPENYILKPELVSAICPRAERGTWQFDVLEKSLSLDDAVFNRAIKLVGKSNLLIARFQGAREIKLHFLRYTSSFYPFVAPDELEKFMGVIDKYYQYYDHIIGRFLTLSSSEDLVFVVSPFSVDPLPPWRSYLEVIFGDKLICGDHFDCPSGLYLAFSRYISPKNLSASLVDFVPTIAYYLGLPVEKESRGRVISEIFTKEFSFENPVFFIHSYSTIIEKGTR